MTDNSGHYAPQEIRRLLNKENELAEAVTAGDAAAFMKAVDETLGLVLLCERQRPEPVKLRVLELCAMLSRAALAGGRNTELIMQTENRLLAAVAAAEYIGAACDVFRELAPVFADGAHPGQTNAGIRRALDCIVRRFAETLDLEQAAEETGLNPSYLSFLFKKHQRRL